MQKAYFKDIRSHIIPLLNNAKNELIIAMAWFTSAELFETTLSCLRRGVKVELVLLEDAINFMYYAPNFNDFISAGGFLRIAKADVGFMHHKFCVIDEKIVITGSYNWTYYAETRNIENIVISDEESVITQFKTEFKRLASKISRVSSSPRLSWDDIEAGVDVDFHELNYEIQKICEVQKKPEKRVFETHTKVTLTNIKKKPVAKYNIGILVLDEKDHETLIVFIKAGNQLPSKGHPRELYYDSKNCNELWCKFIYESPMNVYDRHLLKEENLVQLTKGTSDDNLPIEFSMFLDNNGSLRVDVSCAKTGKRLTISTLDNRLIKYEE